MKKTYCAPYFKDHEVKIHEVMCPMSCGCGPHHPHHPPGPGPFHPFSDDDEIVDE